MPITKIEEAQRIVFIQEMIAKGFSDKSIRKALEQRFDLYSVSSQNRWIKSALEDLYKDNPRKDYIRDINEDRLNQIYITAITDGKLGDAIKCIDLSNKLNGLYVEKKEINLDIDKVIEIEF